jgi:lipopolysaccharide/colanic/teichoic acid biosynthesis glycosyltransferase
MSKQLSGLMGLGQADQHLTIETKERARQLRLGLKRALDLFVAGSGLILALPIAAVIAVAILIDDGRPVLFRQTRVGRKGQLFTMLKFRTMHDGAHARVDELLEHNQRAAPLFKLARDPRVTRVGRMLRRTSLDELPQLVNVLGGTMSLVGPRPALAEEREQFPDVLLDRESVLPGLTGLWQVSGRGDPDFDRYRQFDLDYVNGWTLRLDLWILAVTPFVVVRDAFRPPPYERTPARTPDRDPELEPSVVLEPAVVLKPQDAQRAWR